MKNILILFCFIILISFTSKAQTDPMQAPCMTPPYLPSAITNFLEMVENQPENRSNDVLYIPVTFNVLGNDNGYGHYSVEKTLEALCKLQNDFDPYDFHFYIEGDINFINNDSFYIFPDGYAFSNGMNQFIEEHNAINTMNIYIVEDAEGNAFIAWPDTTDFNLPPIVYYPQNHAIVISKTFLNDYDHVLTHEVGHYFALWHTFHGWDWFNYYQDFPGQNAPDTLVVNDPDFGTVYFPVERVDGLGCQNAGDQICDTPPDYLSGGYGCSISFVQLDPTGAPFQSDSSLFMSYSFDHCQDRFSPKQVEIMQWFAQSDSARSYLLYDQTPPGIINGDELLLNNLSNNDTIYALDSILLEWDMPGADFFLLEFGRITGNQHTSLINDVLKENSLKVKIISGVTHYWIVRGVSNYYPCEVWQDTSYFVVDESVSIQEVGSQNIIRLYPNPATNSLYLNFPQELINNNKSLQISFFDVHGKLIKNQLITNDQKIDISELSDGMYYVKTIDDENMYSGKFVKL